MHVEELTVHHRWPAKFVALRKFSGVEGSRPRGRNRQKTPDKMVGDHRTVSTDEDVGMST